MEAIEVIIASSSLPLPKHAFAIIITIIYENSTSHIRYRSHNLPRLLQREGRGIFARLMPTHGT